MRRVFRWHTAVLTTVALFAGCDDSSSGPTATPSKSAAATATATAAGGPEDKAVTKKTRGRAPKEGPTPSKPD